MAKLHSKKRGKSGTKRPKSKVKPKWVSVDTNELKGIILKFAKEGVSQSKIGRTLRDEHAVPRVREVIGMTIGKFLEKESAQSEYPEDILNLIKKAVHMRNHLKSYKKDIHNKVKLMHVESKIHRLTKYYKQKGRISNDWKYDPETAALLVK